MKLQQKEAEPTAQVMIAHRRGVRLLLGQGFGDFGHLLGSNPFKSLPKRPSPGLPRLRQLLSEARQLPLRLALPLEGLQEPVAAARGLPQSLHQLFLQPMASQNEMSSLFSHPLDSAARSQPVPAILEALLSPLVEPPPAWTGHKRPAVPSQPAPSPVAGKPIRGAAPLV